MSKSGDRLITAAKEALAVARGEKGPAAVYVYRSAAPKEAVRAQKYGGDNDL